MRSRCQGAIRVTAEQGFTGQYERRFFDGRQRVEDCLEFLVLNVRERCRLASRVNRFGSNREDGLAHVLNKLGRENRVIGNYRAIIICACNVPCYADAHHTWGVAYLGKIDARHPGMCHLAHADGEVQQVARFGNIVGIGREPGYVQVRAVMRQWLANGSVVPGG